MSRSLQKWYPLQGIHPRTETGVHTQKKRGIVRELVSSTVSQGLPVVRSWGVLILSSCQKLWLREEHCVWPDNFALQKLNFAAAADRVCARGRIWDLVLCSGASSPSLTSRFPLWSWNPQLPVVSVVFYLATKFLIISLSFIAITIQIVEVENNELVWRYRSVVVLFFGDGTEWQHDIRCLNAITCRYWSLCTEQNRLPNNCTDYRGQCKQQQHHALSFHVFFSCRFLWIMFFHFTQLQSTVAPHLRCSALFLASLSVPSMLLNINLPPILLQTCLTHAPSKI